MAYGEFANIYDKLIYEDIDYTLVSNRILELCKEHRIGYDDYLDLACGTGNVGVNVAKYFKNIYAVDLSEDMLNVAFDKFKKSKIKAKIICQDMSDLSLNHKFNLITSVLDSTNYVTDNEDLIEYFKGVYNHLKEDGLFIFDINSYYKLSTILGNNIYTYNSDDVFYTWENVFEDEILNMFLTFFVKDKDTSLYEKFEEEHIEKAYKEEYIEKVLRQCGFKMLGKFEGYVNKDVDEESERIVYVVSK